MIRYITLICFFLFSSFSNAYAKTSYIDIENIFKNSLLGKSINDQINVYETDKKKELKFIENNLKTEEAKLLSKKNIITKEEFNDLLNILSKKVEDYNLQNKNLKNKILRLRSENTNFILEQIQPILTQYVKENNISLLLNKKNLVMGKKELDITPKIIQSLDSKIKKLELNLNK
tara:strand:+ start:72 stop:596 length:525 start_codon:yes stop_codon:yes gene_type:complete